MTEAFNKEWQPKFEAALKKIVDADKAIAGATLVKHNAIEKLKELKTEFETSKGTFAKLVKEIA